MSNAKKPDKLERRWLIACLLISTVASVVWYVDFLQNMPWYLEGDSTALVWGFIGRAIWSLLLTLFVVGIPSRLVMNLVVPSRRKRCQNESIILALTFIAIAIMFWSMYAYPARG